MNNEHKFTRRDILKSMGALTAGLIIKPSFVFAESASVRFAVIGDWGTGKNEQLAICKQMQATHRQQAFDFVISAGDNIYPNGNSRYFAPNFERPFAGLLENRVNFYTVLGNHDVRDGREGQMQYPLFNMGGRNYYTLSRSNNLVEFFMLDSNDFIGLAQLGWLEKSLRNSTARWKIAVLHHPLYSSGHAHGSTMPLRILLEPLFTHYNVNIVLAGHDHIYERTLPQHGIQHFVSGGAGKTRTGDVDLKSSFRAASYDKGCHFMAFEITDREARFQAISDSGLIVDSGAIKPA